MHTNRSKQFQNAGHQVLAPPPPIRVRKIVATTDFSAESRAGVTYALNLAQRLGAAVVLLHVIEPLPPMEGMQALPLLSHQADLKRQARIQLKKIIQRQSKPGLRLTASLRTGKPFHAIITDAGQREADLIVMATHGYTGINHVLLGSTAERVVRHAPCPVLTVRAKPLPPPAAKTPPLKLRKLLVPIDFSDTSKTALPWAALLARLFHAEVILLHVTERFPIDYLMGPELMNQAITPLMKEAEATLQLLAASLNTCTGLKASALVRDGAPYKEICQAAQDLGADLIALTTHGYTGLKHLWLGSTAERVLRHASCPVLVVRESKNLLEPNPLQGPP